MYKIIVSIFFSTFISFGFSITPQDKFCCLLKNDSSIICTAITNEVSVLSAGSKSSSCCYTTDILSDENIDLDIKLSSTDTVLFELNQEVTAQIIKLPADELQKKKWILALSAFPFPMGFVGAHRVMLGTKPWIPIVYVATFGGCFGLLPLIDFFVILNCNDIKQYENNPNLFMWIK